MQNSTLITVKVACSAFAAIAASCNQPIKYPEGGYDYPTHIAAKDTAFYYLPLRKAFSRRDSFNRATNFFPMSFFNEPNLSMGTGKEDVFRFIYAEALGGTIFIDLAEHEITIKSLYFTSDARRDDSSVLTKTEQYLLRVLERHFPLDSGKYENRPYMRKRFDSLLAIYPQLRDVNYYWSLETKRLVPDTNAKVKITKISITRKDFYHIVSVINASGYWKMPWKIACDSYPTDGYGFTLEANTTKKYNYVELGSCTDNTPMQVAFEKACQELVHYAKLDKEISLVSDWKIDSVHIDSARWKHL